MANIKSINSNPIVLDDTGLADGAVITRALHDNAVIGDKLNDGAVRTSKLADNAVTTAKLANGAVTAPKIGTAAVSTPKIADNAVIGDKINDNAVRTAKIANSAVTTPKVANGAVTDAKLASGGVKDTKIPWPVNTSKFGRDGQILATHANGAVEWVDQQLPSVELMEQAVENWLDEHPEATTTVQDDSVTESKLSRSFSNTICRTFDTASEMCESTDIKEGMICRTNGFYSDGDNGAAYYEVVSNVEPNGMDVLALQNGIAARLIVNDVVSIMQIGCSPSGSDAIDDYIVRAFQICDRVMLGDGQYYINSIEIPHHGELFGVSGSINGSNSINFSDGTRIIPATLNTPIRMSNSSCIHGLTFIEPDLRPTDINTVNKDYDHVIDITGGHDIDIYDIYFGAINKGIVASDSSTSGNIRIHDIYGCCLSEYFNFQRILDWLSLRHCIFNIGFGYSFFPDNALYVAYVLKNNTLLSLGRIDYGLFDDIAIFVTGYAVRAEYNNVANGGCRNSIFNNLRIDGATKCIATPNSDLAHLNNCRFCNCVFVPMAQEAVRAQDYNFDGSETDIWGAYSFVNISGTNTRISIDNCLVTSCLYNAIYAGNKAIVTVQNCFINGISTYIALNSDNAISCYMFTSDGGKVYAKNNELRLNNSYSMLVRSISSGAIVLDSNVITGTFPHSSNEYLSSGIDYINNLIPDYTEDYVSGFANLNVCNIPHVGIAAYGNNTLYKTGDEIELPLGYLSKFKSFKVYLARWGSHVFIGQFQANSDGTNLTNRYDKFNGYKGHLYTEENGSLVPKDIYATMAKNGVITIETCGVSGGVGFIVFME